jgi:hypothetical protein
MENFELLFHVEKPLDGSDDILKLFNCDIYGALGLIPNP